MAMGRSSQLCDHTGPQGDKQQTGGNLAKAPAQLTGMLKPEEEMAELRRRIGKRYRSRKAGARHSANGLAARRRGAIPSLATAFA